MVVLVVMDVDWRHLLSLEGALLDRCLLHYVGGGFNAETLLLLCWSVLVNQSDLLLSLRLSVGIREVAEVRKF